MNVMTNNLTYSYLEYEKMDEKNLKRHIHPTYEILYVVEGELEYVIEDCLYRLTAGDVLLIKPAKYHFVKNIIKPPYKRVCIQFSSNFIKNNLLLNKVFDKFLQLQV